MKDKKLILLLLGGCMLQTACHRVQDAPETVNYYFRNDTVCVQNPVWKQQLKTTEAVSVGFSKEVVTAGTVRPIPTEYASISSPFAGRVLRSNIRIGQQVVAGSPLFEISSPDFISAQKDYFQAYSAKELARKDLLRKQDLLVNGVGAQRELDEAQNTLAVTEKEYENASAALRVYQVSNVEQVSLGQPLVVCSPISGSIIKNDLVTGEYLKEDADPVVVVADLSRVWISAQVKEKDIRFIAEGDELEVEVAAFPDTRIKGTVYHIEESVDEETRSIQVLSECDNTARLLKLGMYTTVHFRSRPLHLIAVPETALLQGEKGIYVYVEVSDGCFVRRNVEVEASENGTAIVRKGIQMGEKVLSEGGYYLK